MNLQKGACFIDSWNQVVTPSLWSGSTFPTVGTNFVGPGVSMVAHLTNNIDPTTLNEFTFSYTTDHIFLTPFGTWQRPSSMTMTGFFNNGFGGKLPAVQIDNGGAYGGGFTVDAAGWPWNNANPTFTFRDQIAKIMGPHNVYAGFYYAAQQKNENNGAETQGYLHFNNSSDVTTGNAWADFLQGRASQFNQTNMQTKYYYRSRTFEPYIQDDWHIRRNLTLNLGFRASFFGSYNEKYSNFYNFYPELYDPASAPRIDVTGKVTGQQGSLIPGIGNPYDGMKACYNCSDAKLFNPAPRVGFAWDPFNDGKWAIRGGYGMFFEHLNGNEVISNLEGNPPGILNPTQYNAVGYTNLGAGGLFGTISTAAYPKNTIWPYMQQWHLDVQHDLMANTVVTLSYVGSKGTHLIWQRDLNQLFPTSADANPFQPGQPLTDAVCGTLQNAWLSNVSAVVNGQTITGPVAQNIAVACGKSADPYRAYQGFGNITTNEAGANSTYNALQTSFRRTMARSQLTASYTWSHSIDNASSQNCGGCVDTYNMALKRASSDFDVRHLLTFGYVLDLPYLNNKPAVMKWTLGGWQWSGLWKFNTGTPFNVTAGNGNGLHPGGGVGGIGSTYPELIGDPYSKPAVKDTANVPGPLLFNPAAFAAPTGLTFGNFGRNVLNLPNRNNWDMGMFKRFYIGELRYFEFRAEAFNVFNHTQFSGINSGISCYGGANNSAGDSGCITEKDFLHPNAAHLPRILQFGMKFIF